MKFYRLQTAIPLTEHMSQQKKQKQCEKYFEEIPALTSYPRVDLTLKIHGFINSQMMTCHSN